MEFPFLLEQFRNEYQDMVQTKNVNNSSFVQNAGDVTVLQSETSSDGSELEDDEPS